MRVGLLGAWLLLLAFAGCDSSTCTSNSDCHSGEICAGPAQGPFQCHKACTSSTECPGDMGCMPLSCIDCQVVVDVCFPLQPPLMSR